MRKNKIINLNELRDKAYKCACEHGFHDCEYSSKHYLMLAITELSEAVEADRKGKRVLMGEFNRMDKLSDFGFRAIFERCIKDTVEDELADTVIRLLDFAALFNIEVTIPDKNIRVRENLFMREAFAMVIFDITAILIIYTDRYSPEKAICDTIAALFGFAKCLHIDLIWHIKQKMKYNELRAPMHGKKY